MRLKKHHRKLITQIQNAGAAGLDVSEIDGRYLRPFRRLDYIEDHPKKKDFVRATGELRSAIKGGELEFVE